METKIEENDKSKSVDENIGKIIDSNELNEESLNKCNGIEAEIEKNIENDSKTIAENDNVNLEEVVANDGKDSTNVNLDQIIPNDKLTENDNIEVIDCEENEDESANIEEIQIVAEKNIIDFSLDTLPEGTVQRERSLVADYRSASESDSYDSESDSSSDDSDESDEESDSDPNDKKRRPKKERKLPKDLTYADLPPIEDLKISVREDECEEIGTVTSIVDTLAVVECYKGTAPLDIDSVLFLEKGKKTLGKIFDVIGPVSEPVYTVRFTNVDQIKRNGIEKGMKVFCAPRTDYSSYVFLPDLLKMKGSDASWKDNVEAPAECQDFSDDEEEQKHKSVLRNVRNENNRRRFPDENPPDFPNKIRSWKTHNNSRPPGKYLNPSRFQNPHKFQRSVSNYPAGSSWSYQPQMTPSQSSPSFTPFANNPFGRPADPIYPNTQPFSNYRFSNVPPFPPANFVFNATAPPPPPPPPPAPPTQSNSYPTRMTGPPPFSSFMTAPPGNRMPMAPFPFGQGFAQQPNFYSQPMQSNSNAHNSHSLPSPMSRTFGSDVRGPPPPPPPSV